MNNHLTNEQFNQQLLAESTPWQTRHLSECKECAAKLGLMRDAFVAFRDSVHTWTGRHPGACPPTGLFLQRPSGSARRRALRWSFASATLTIAMLAPIYWHSLEKQQRAREAADTLLLEQVNAQLSRSVPASVEPFAGLLPEVYSVEKGETR